MIFRHRIIKMHLFSPGRDGSLGSVEHSFNPRSAYQRIGNFFIGTRPIWFGTALVCLLGWYLLGPSPSDAIHDQPGSIGAASLPVIASRSAAIALQIFMLLIRPSVVATWKVLGFSRTSSSALAATLL